MSNRFLDSMQHYGTSNINKKYNIINGPSWQVGSAASPRGTDVLQSTSDGTGGYVGAFLGRTFNDQDTWIVGFRVSYPNVGCGSPIFKMFDHNGNRQFTLALQFGGLIGAYRGGIGGFDGSGTLLGVSTGSPLFSGVYAFIELKVVLHPSAGSVQVRVDNTVVLNLTGINTDNTGLASASVIGFGGGNCGTIKFCDFYVHDGQGSEDIAFWGDTQIDFLRPVSNGDANDYIPVGSLNNFENVDEVPPSVVDYNKSNTPGDIELYTFDPIPTTTLIKCIQAVGLYEKDDGNDRRVMLSTKTGGSVFNGSIQDVPSSSGYLLERFANNPDTGIDWVVADANAAQFGSETQN